MSEIKITTLTELTQPRAADVFPIVDWDVLTTKRIVFGRLFTRYDVKHYGATGGGVADDTSDIQDAIDACVAAGGGTVYFPAGTYKVTDSLDLTGTQGVTVAGDNYLSTTILSEAAGKPVFDLVGARYLKFTDLGVSGAAGSAPATAFFSARTTGGASVGDIVFRDVMVSGTFTVSAWYFIDSEVITTDCCRTLTLIAPYVYYGSTDNDHSIPSAIAVDDTTYNTCCVHHLYACLFHTHSAQNTVMIRLGYYCSRWQIRDSFWTARGTGVGVRVDDDVFQIVIDGCSQEGTSDTFLRVSDNARLDSLTFMNCRIAQKMISMGTGSSMRWAFVENIDSNANNNVGMELTYLQKCAIRRWWVNDTAQVTIENMTDSEFWAPDLSNVTISGLNRYNRLRQQGFGTRQIQFTEQLYFTMNGTIDASAIMELESTTRGLLPPRMTTVQKNAIGAPSAGLLVFDTTTDKLECYDGAAWQACW